MTSHVLELNDRGLLLADSSGIVFESPGFAVATDSGKHVGAAAESMARLHPTSSFNKFWQELSLDPLSNNTHFRHHADIAYEHLLHIAEETDAAGDVIVAVPSNFNQQQLAILLGLARQTPLNPVGLVSSALAASVSEPGHGSLIHVDQMLHQAIITRLQLVDGHMRIESVVEVPGVGSQNCLDLMMSLATDAFIQQCRFNPQHNADSEQTLYNTLPEWLHGAPVEQGSLVMELGSGEIVHTARLPRETLTSELNRYYKKLAEQVSALNANGESSILVSHRLNDLPGLRESLQGLGEVRMLHREAVHAACQEYASKLVSPADAMTLVKTIQVSNPEGSSDSAGSGTAAASLPQPTHLLHGARAIPLGNVQIVNAPINGSEPPIDEIHLQVKGLPRVLGQVVKKAGGIVVEAGSIEYFVNDTRAKGEQALQLGDTVCFSQGGETISLIRVHDG